MQTQKLGLLLAVLFVVAGCGRPLVGGGFCMRSSSVTTEDDSGIGNEIAGYFQISPKYATEFSTGSWEIDSGATNPSVIASKVDRITGLYVHKIDNKRILRAGGGLTVTTPKYRMGLTESEHYLTTYGVVADVDLNPTFGVHFQIDFSYITDNGLTFGAYYMNTSAKAKGTLYATDGTTSNSGDIEFDLSNSAFGLMFGARF